MANSDNVEKSVEGAEKYRSLLTITFIYVCLYVGIVATSVSDRAILLGEFISMPATRILNAATIPSRIFYILSPLAIIGLHLHLLLQQYILSRVHINQGESDADIPRHVLLPHPMFRYLIRRDEAWVGWIVQFALFVIYVVLPLSVLCIVQFKFLPYHSVFLTLYHQSAVAFDLAMTWFFLGPWRWPIRAGKTLRFGKVLARTACGLVLVFSLGIAIVPGTFAERLFGEIFGPMRGRYIDLSGELLVSGLASPSSTVVGSNGVLKGSLESTAIGAQLAGRELQGADFSGAILVNAELREADLSNSSLRNADLRGADLKSAKLLKADLRNANLAGLVLAGADLRGGNLQGADLTAADLAHAKLDGVNLNYANLDAASFDGASLQGASLHRVTARATSFRGADLLGAQLTEAKLLIANFRNANLIGTDFRLANLSGAEGLRFESTDLRGAYLACACDVRFADLSDLRYIDFNPQPLDEWMRLESELNIKPIARNGSSAATSARIDRAMKRCSSDEAQAQCLGTPLGFPALVNGRRLLYLDEQRTGVLGSWPPIAKQARGLWSEGEFRKQLASELLAHSCSNPELAAKLAQRAAGKYVPGDIEFDLELAEQLLLKIDDERTCVVLRSIPEKLTREIRWIVRQERKSRGGL